DEDFRFGQLRRGRGQARNIALAEKPVAYLLQILARARAKETLDELLTAHFQTEYSDRELFIDRNMFGKVQRKRGFSHAGPGHDHNHFRRMHSAGHAIELDET